MTKLSLLGDLLRALYLYAYSHDNRSALEHLAEIRRLITQAESFHRRPTIIDPLEDEDL